MIKASRPYELRVHNYSEFNSFNIHIKECINFSFNNNDTSLIAFFNFIEERRGMKKKIFSHNENIYVEYENRESIYINRSTMHSLLSRNQSMERTMDFLKEVFK
jgi:hypothetical protein